jgi:hypothetical protein
MWSRLSFTGLAVLLFAGGAAAQQGGPVGSPTVYVCTASAEVLKVEGNSVSTIAKGTGEFGDCVFGPDGNLYIANGTAVVKVDPLATAKKGQLPAPTSVVTGLASAARGLAFNGNTLYINTASNGVYSFSGNTLTQVFGAGTGQGQGIVFEITGTLAAATGTSIRRSSFDYVNRVYQAPASASVSPATPAGIAVNTCGDVVFADTTSGQVKSLLKGGLSGLGTDVVSFAGTGVPVNVEIDMSNRAFILVGDDAAGLNARVVRVDPNIGTDTTGQAYITTCNSFNAPVALPDLKVKNAVGLALGPSAHRLTWSVDGLTHAFDFGYYQLQYNFTATPATTMFVTAYKVPQPWVRFSNTFPVANAQAIATSPLGGLAAEWVLQGENLVSPFPTFTGTYSYFTQDLLGHMGIGRSATDTVASNGGVYTQDVAHDFWDLGAAFDPRSGETGDGWSKRVLYNAPISGGCHITSYGQPFNSQNPLFNNPQTIPISIQTSGCNGKTIRISIVRTNKNNEEQIVHSNSQTDNFMQNNGGGKFSFVLDAGYLDTLEANVTPAEFLMTFWGDVATQSKTFSIKK